MNKLTHKDGEIHNINALASKTGKGIYLNGYSQLRIIEQQLAFFLGIGHVQFVAELSASTDALVLSTWGTLWN